MLWDTDVFGERKMLELDVDFVEVEVSIDEFDFEKSSHNMARLFSPIDQGVVDQYEHDMRAGHVFPKPIVFRPPGSGLFLIAGGNHRVRAAKQGGVKSIPCYHANSDDQTVMDLLPRCLNSGHGVRVGGDEAVLHAIYAIKQHGFSSSEAAELFQTTTNRITDKMRCQKLADEMENVGVKATKLTEAHLKQAGKLQANVAVMAAAGAVMLKHRVTATEAGRAIDEVREHKTEAKQLEAVAIWDKQLTKVAPHSARYQKKRSAFLAAITHIERVSKGVSRLEQVQISDLNEKEAVYDRIREIAAWCQSIVGSPKASRNGSAPSRLVGARQR